MVVPAVVERSLPYRPVVQENTYQNLSRGGEGREGTERGRGDSRIKVTGAIVVHVSLRGKILRGKIHSIPLIRTPRGTQKVTLLIRCPYLTRSSVIKEMVPHSSFGPEIEISALAVTAHCGVKRPSN